MIKLNDAAKLAMIGVEQDLTGAYLRLEQERGANHPEVKKLGRKLKKITDTINNWDRR